MSTDPGRPIVSEKRRLDVLSVAPPGTPEVPPVEGEAGGGLEGGSIVEHDSSRVLRLFFLDQEQVASYFHRLSGSGLRLAHAVRQLDAAPAELTDFLAQVEADGEMPSGINLARIGYMMLRIPGGTLAFPDLMGAEATHLGQIVRARGQVLAASRVGDVTQVRIASPDGSKRCLLDFPDRSSRPLAYSEIKGAIVDAVGLLTSPRYRRLTVGVAGLWVGRLAPTG